MVFDRTSLWKLLSSCNTAKAEQAALALFVLVHEVLQRLGMLEHVDGLRKRSMQRRVGPYVHFFSQRHNF